MGTIKEIWDKTSRMVTWPAYIVSFITLMTFIQPYWPVTQYQIKAMAQDFQDKLIAFQDPILAGQLDNKISGLEMKLAFTKFQLQTVMRALINETNAEGREILEGVKEDLGEQKRSTERAICSTQKKLAHLRSQVWGGGC